jgi:sialidase-1
MISAVGDTYNRAGNPAVVFDTIRKRIVLVYARHSAQCGGNCVTGNSVVFSSDDGVTWTRPKNLDNQWDRARNSMPGPGVMVQLTEGDNVGRIVLPSHSGKAYAYVYILYSDDGGETWKISPSSLPGLDETTITQLPNGKVQINSRNKLAKTLGRAVSFSEDDGVTWSEIRYDARLAAPICQGSLATFGGITYFSNPRSSSSRSNINVQCTIDNTMHWAAARLIEVQKTQGYSCLVQGTLMNHADAATHPKGGILYEGPQMDGVWGSILFASFPAGHDSAKSECLLDSDEETD